MRLWVINTLLIAFVSGPLACNAVEVNGKVGLSALLYTNKPLKYFNSINTGYSEQHQQQWSVLSEIEFYQGWNDDQDSLLFKPYVRIDQHDDERTHFDIRELVWQHIADDWELRTGISKVFWGVNEANHLVPAGIGMNPQAQQTGIFVVIYEQFILLLPANWERVSYS